VDSSADRINQEEIVGQECLVPAAAKLSPISGEDAFVFWLHGRRCSGFVAAWLAASLAEPQRTSAILLIIGSRLAPAGPVQLRQHPAFQRSLRFSDA